MESAGLSELIRRLQDVEAWRRLAPALTITDDLLWSDPWRPVPGAYRRAGQEIARAGYTRVDWVVDEVVASSLAAAAGAVRREGLHPVFVFVYDEAWRMLSRLSSVFSSALGLELEVKPDFWAWHVDPRVDAGGWAPHRDVWEDVRGEDGLPSLVDVWVSLSRATLRNACMYVVPIGDDPGWPTGLGEGPEDLRGGRPVPTERGSALAWNANVMHWGGGCDDTYEEPRVSVSCTLGRPGWGFKHRGKPWPPVARQLSFVDRLDRIADEIVTYGSFDLSPDAPLARWASIVRTMARLGRAGAKAR